LFLFAFVALFAISSSQRTREIKKNKKEKPVEVSLDPLDSTAPNFGSAYPHPSSPPPSSGEETLLLEETVSERGLVSPNVTLRSVVENHHSVFRQTQQKAFTADTLGYVTPWNRHGYDIAISFAAKFTYLAPVWYQIEVSESEEDKQNKKKIKIHVSGGHDADEAWMTAIRNASNEIRLVPRFLIEANANNYQRLLLNDKLQTGFINKIKAECDKHNFAGIVLEASDAWLKIPPTQPKLRSALNSFVVNITKALHAMKPSRELVLVVPPYNERLPYFQAIDFQAVYQHVDKFSLMTYDYSSQQSPGPSAPLDWMAISVKSLLGSLINQPAVTKKILLGLNFYGMDFSSAGAKPLLGRDYVQLLRILDMSAASLPTPPVESPHLTWDPASHEHFVGYRNPTNSEQHLVYYPTLQSLSDRLELANEFQTGLSIWELGQGLDYFMDLL